MNLCLKLIFNALLNAYAKNSKNKLWIVIPLFVYLKKFVYFKEKKFQMKKKIKKTVFLFFVFV